MTNPTCPCRLCGVRITAHRWRHPYCGACLERVRVMRVLKRQLGAPGRRAYKSLHAGGLVPAGQAERVEFYSQRVAAGLRLFEPGVAPTGRREAG